MAPDRAGTASAALPAPRIRNLAEWRAHLLERLAHQPLAREPLVGVVAQVRRLKGAADDLGDGEDAGDRPGLDVDREQAALFMIFDESGLGEAEREAAEYASLNTNNAAPVKTWAQTQELIEQGSRHAINGYIFGNLPGLELNEGERVRWYLFGLGSEKDFHTAHWHGQRVLEDPGMRLVDPDVVGERPVVEELQHPGPFEEVT